MRRPRGNELHGERFVAFDVGIVIDQNSKALSGFTGVKGQDAGNNSEVATNRCHTVDLCTRSEGKVLDRDAPTNRGDARSDVAANDSDGKRATSLGCGVTRTGE